MKKSLSFLIIILSVVLSVSSCELPASSTGKTIASGFLNVTAEESYLPSCGVELCFCEHAKQNFTYTVIR